MDIEELRAKAKEADIKSYWNKKPEKLMVELGLAEPEKPTVGLSIEIEEGFQYLQRAGFDKEDLAEKAKHMGADKAVYVHRYRKFDLYKNNKVFDSLSLISI